MKFKDRSAFEVFSFFNDQMQNFFLTFSPDISNFIRTSETERKEHREIDHSFLPFVLTRIYTFQNLEFTAELILEAFYWNDDTISNAQVKLNFNKSNENLGGISALTKSESDQINSISFNFEDMEIKGKIENIVKGNLC